MAQSAKVIDITKSYVPVDPRTFPNTLHGTQREDSPTQEPEVVAYEGYNFLPTGYGYKSYFGINGTLGVDALPARCDRVLVYQTETMSNELIALCEDGIYTKIGESAGAWTQVVEEDLPEEGVHYNWSYALMGEDLYFYRAGSDNLWKRIAKPIYQTVAPTALLLANITHTAFADAGGLAAGTYTYSARYKITGELWSDRSPEYSITIAAASDLRVSIDFTSVAPITRLRIFRTSGATVKYREFPITSDLLTYEFFDEVSEDALWLDYVAADEDLDTDEILYAVGTYRPATPSFLNMPAQKGIFSAGMRLGFWDSENSTAWSSIDDAMDLTPSIETLAGSAIFGDVAGTIVTVIPHGEGWIIYATKSIVWVRRNVEATFQWDPKVIFSNNGIAYSNCVTASNPDTTHFAWTSTGLYKIENGKEEVIVPEFYDFLKQVDAPVFLQVLEGRYLFIQPLDADIIYGNVEYTINEIEPTVITFPIANVPEWISSPITITGNDLCNTWGSIGAQGGRDAEVIAAAAAAGSNPPAEDADGNINYQPVWTAHFSYGQCPEIESWDSTPCGTSDLSGNPWHMSPVAKTTADLTAGTDGKMEMGPDAWQSGGWTIERFIAVQTAIWEQEEANREAFLNEVLSRAFSDSATTEGGSDATVPDAYSFCSVGQYPKEYAGPYFGYNSCSVWMTRLLVSAVDVENITVTRVSSSSSGDQKIPATYKYNYWVGVGNSDYNQDSVAEAKSLLYAYIDSLDPVENVLTWNETRHGATGTTNIHNIGINPLGPTCPAGYTNAGEWCVKDTTWTTNTSKGTYNKGETVPALGIDTASCTLSGWRYLGEDGEWHYVSSTNACQAPDYTPPAPDATPPAGDTQLPDELPPVVDQNGSICGIPFEPVTVPGIGVGAITWPVTSVTIPGGSYLMQEGSADPIYPTRYGAYVYDLHLKKWGKLKLAYQQLFDFSPINGSYNNPIPYNRFGVEAGVLLEDGTIRMFDTEPTDSYIKYGKIGYSRLGMTELHEIVINMKDACDFSVLVEASMNGKSPETLLSETSVFVDSNTGVVYSDRSARWYSISIQGNYDITHLEFRGTKSSRR